VSPVLEELAKAVCCEGDTCLSPGDCRATSQEALVTVNPAKAAKAMTDTLCRYWKAQSINRNQRED
jgi:hypothetical protein